MLPITSYRLLLYHIYFARNLDLVMLVPYVGAIDSLVYKRMQVYVHKHTATNKI